MPSRWPNHGSGLDTGAERIHLGLVRSYQKQIMTYDYVCMACAHAWEAEQRITEAPLTECPHCLEHAAKRQVSGGQGFILKGGGWYSDLYSSAKPGSESSAKPGSEKPESTTPTTAASAKPEKKSDAASPCTSGACGTSACPAAAAN